MAIVVPDPPAKFRGMLHFWIKPPATFLVWLDGSPIIPIEFTLDERVRQILMSEADSMRVPKRELPDIESIRERAGWNLPAHCRLKDVRCEYGSMALPGVPDDFQIVIEYENLLEET